MRATIFISLNITNEIKAIYQMLAITPVWMLDPPCPFVEVYVEVIPHIVYLRPKRLGIRQLAENIRIHS